MDGKKWPGLGTGIVYFDQRMVAPKNKISTSQRGEEHQFAGQNLQQTGLPGYVTYLLFFIKLCQSKKSGKLNNLNNFDRNTI